MKRRNFILGTALSVGFISNTLASADIKNKSVENNLQQYLSAIGAHGELKFLCDDQLSADYAFRSLSYLKSGYKSYGFKFYFCSKQSVAICPLVLSAGTSGVIDIATLFFRKNTSNEWKYCNSFSGFHLESIATVLPELIQKYTAGQLADLLVPIQNHPENTNPHTLLTKTGSLRLIVKFDDNGAKSNFSLHEKNVGVFALNSISEHSLYSNSLI